MDSKQPADEEAPKPKQTNGSSAKGTKFVDIVDAEKSSHGERLATKLLVLQASAQA
jgi:hypothetical protein